MNLRLDRINALLASLDAKGLYRALRRLEGSGGKFTDAGRTILNFSSNDYLNLAADPRLKHAACETIQQYGCGATASRLMSGHLALHARLESDLAALTGMDQALVFSSGFQANLGVLCSLSDEDTVIFCDKLNHASIIDGALLSGARFRAYKHCDAKDLLNLIKADTKQHNRIIVSDAVFSMDGDLAPIEALAEIAEAHDALLVIDEAHAVGIHGKGGGLCRERGIRPDVLVGTLSKALGSQGGFVATSEPIRRLLINRARSFIYSTGLAPGCAGSALAAIGIVREEPDLGTELLARAAHFRRALQVAGLSPLPSISPILPVVVGDNERVLRITARLWERGILAAGVRPPTVPDGTARLRLSVTLAHTREDLEFSASEIAEAVRAEFA